MAFQVYSHSRSIRIQNMWDPHQYEKFKDERYRPGRDLIRMLRPKRGSRVVDLGCGTGELTFELHEFLNARETLGIDTSDAMLQKARKNQLSGVRFEHQNIADFNPGAVFDVVFSNAALHWLPDHPRLFAQLKGMLKPGGQLAVQMPANHDQPTHVVAAKVAREFDLQGHETNWPVLPVDEYASLMHRLGFSGIDARVQVYPHLLKGPEHLVEWFKGSLLTHYEKQLSPAEYARFLEVYQERLLSEVPDQRPFFFAFKRILLYGVLVDSSEARAPEASEG